MKSKESSQGRTTTSRHTNVSTGQNPSLKLQSTKARRFKRFGVLELSIWSLFGTWILFFGAYHNCYAQDAKQIIQRAEDAIKGKVSSYSVMEMIIRTPDYTRTMKMESWTSGTSKALVKILSPVREAGNRTLKLGNDIWMYLRNTETTIRIPPSMMLQSWNGSDYTYDDMVREETLTKDYDITLTGTEQIGGVDCWKLQLIPKPNAPVVWGKIVYWVRKADDLPEQVEYFDERGKLMRTMIMSDFKVMGGRIIPTAWTMYNSDKTHSTEIKMDEASFDKRIPDQIFSLKELER